MSQNTGTQRIDASIQAASSIIRTLDILFEETARQLGKDPVEERRQGKARISHFDSLGQVPMALRAAIAKIGRARSFSSMK